MTLCIFIKLLINHMFALIYVSSFFFLFLLFGALTLFFKWHLTHTMTLTNQQTAEYTCNFVTLWENISAIQLATRAIHSVSPFTLRAMSHDFKQWYICVHSRSPFFICYSVLVTNIKILHSTVIVNFFNPSSFKNNQNGANEYLSPVSQIIRCKQIPRRSCVWVRKHGVIKVPLPYTPWIPYAFVWELVPSNCALSFWCYFPRMHMKQP